ncbi:hypothetical protein RDWZM_005418 [Blomia tropicalis]|uniref:Protein FAM60A n=1 Tax=Blomia tropicalis TaxID=40697 RepID=A0A9Q0RMD5_BLOTA|nr:hypothetical protein RDWZM_005418 [Blomia tropicalis]
MFSFHKPKIYRSNSGCCICRAKSSSSRFTDSKKYEPEFERCFRIVEKRSGEICNACVLLVKRWKKLPSGTNRNWHHVVDARAGPGTKSFKNKPISSGENKKRSFNKPNRNISALCKESKVRLQTLSSSDSESDEEDEEEIIDELDTMADSASGNRSNDQRSLRRSNRLNVSTSEHKSRHFKKSSNNGTDRNNNLNSDNKKRRMRGPEHLFSFLDTTFWQKEKVCCGIIFKGPNNEVIICPKLLRPCPCRQQMFALARVSCSNNSVSRSSPTNSLSTSNDINNSVTNENDNTSTLTNIVNSNVSNSNTNEPNKSTTQSEPIIDVSLVSKSLQHQDSFANSDTCSEIGSINGSHDELTDDQSSGVGSMTNCDEANLEISSALSDRSVSSGCLLMDVDDGSSNASTATNDGLNHHEIELSNVNPLRKTNQPETSVRVASLGQTMATAVV